MKNSRSRLEEINAVVKSSNRTEDKMAQICEALLEIEDIDMVGFYLIDEDRPERLVKGPHRGLDNPNPTIPFGEGLSGQVADRQVSIVLNDVSEELNHISIDPEVRSEASFPLFRNGQLCGLMNVISKRPARFDENIRLFLEETAMLLTDRI